MIVYKQYYICYFFSYFNISIFQLKSDGNRFNSLVLG